MIQRSILFRIFSDLNKSKLYLDDIYPPLKLQIMPYKNLLHVPYNNIHPGQTILQTPQLSYSSNPWHWIELGRSIERICVSCSISEWFWITLPTSTFIPEFSVRDHIHDSFACVLRWILIVKRQTQKSQMKSQSSLQPHNLSSPLQSILKSSSHSKPSFHNNNRNNSNNNNRHSSSSKFLNAHHRK